MSRDALPIEDDDATIAAALEEASVPVLMLSMVHMSGDIGILRGRIRPQGTFLTEEQGMMSEEDQAEIRARALEIIKAYRDRGCTLPPPCSPEALLEMMNFLVADEVPEEYIPMMLEEMELDGSDARAVKLEQAPQDNVLQHFHVLVIGAGMSGLLAAIRLQQAGIPYTVIEKNASVGGTWYENTYPGSRVDVTNYFYCYSFEPNPEWNYYYAEQPELRAYFEHCANKYGVREHIRFDTEVLAAEYQEDTQQWSVRVRDNEGREDTLSATALISAVGQLNRPKLPDIPGRDRFKGTTVHSGAWDPSIDLDNKRVAVVGSGASAFQIVPAIAADVEQLYVFQRSAPWMIPNPKYHERVGEGKRWCLKHLPYYASWYRFLLFWSFNSWDMDAFRIDPEWPHQDRSSSKVNDDVRRMLVEHLETQLDDRPELLHKVIPDYPPLGKRPLQDNGSWLAALRRSNVRLVTDKIERIDESGLRTADGEHYAVDAIVYATGFHANRFLWPMDIVGRNGIRLRDQWGNTPRAFLGITVPNFPNLFCLYGPGTNLGHAGSIVFHSECQVRYIMECLKSLLENGRASMECRRQAHDEYNEKLRDTLAGMVWSHPSVKNSWYRNEEGVVTILSPWRLVDYWKMTRRPDPTDYEFR